MILFSCLDAHPLPLSFSPSPGRCRRRRPGRPRLSRPRHYIRLLVMGNGVSWGGRGPGFLKERPGRPVAPGEGGVTGGGGVSDAI
ncbi:hypothetical protein NL676_009575 [Syzygium grande]|nr:hypothetical protein NL676_009575 [Syzygium grande]